jgi:TolB-like protein
MKMNYLRMAVNLLPFVVGCSLSPGNIESKQSPDLDARHIRRIAVLPADAILSSQPAQNPLLGASADKKIERQDPGDVLIRLVYLEMARMPNWQIVSDNEVREVGENVAPGNGLARMRKIGELVYADAVITGRVRRYRERVGNEIGVKSAASVAFTLELVDVRRGDVVWSTSFDETQKGLSENILALGDIGWRGIRWLTAEQLTQDGVRKVVTQLHEAIARGPTS